MGVANHVNGRGMSRPNCRLMVLRNDICLCRPQSWNQHAQFLLDVANTQLSLVLLGTDGLANQLVNEIRVSLA